MKLAIEKIEVSSEFYPRQKPDDDVIARYRTAIDLLPPVDVAQINGSILLIDGYQRILAHKLEQRTEIEANIRTDLDSADAVLMEAIRANNKHGSQLSLKDKQRLARQLFGKYTIEQIAIELSVSARSVREWVKDLRELAEFRWDIQVIAFHLSGHTSQDIAETMAMLTKTQTQEERKKELHSTRVAIDRLIDDYAQNGKLSELCIILSDQNPKDIIKQKQLIIEEYLGDHLVDPCNPPPNLKSFNLWQFQDCDEHYGADYPGRVPGQIIENLLWYYTDTFGHVYDPFAGSGTTIDVCRAMFRRYWASDIRPFDTTKRIKQHDILEGSPDFFPKGYKMDLIFLDPPYWQQKKGDYSGDESNLANLPLNEFYQAIDAIAHTCHELLKTGGVIACIIGPTQESGVIYDHAIECHKRFANIFNPIARVIVPYTTQQVKGFHVADAQQNRYMLKLYRDLLIYRKEG